ncbi:T-cell surface antigen CD2 [Panthera pardus]|uniref:CD2 molecule n=3 Tax=Panthera TaxID=9688 RepID=A0A8C8XK37_PANLE|nr:T-cell surface antigen CD2 [Panthera pardus]
MSLACQIFLLIFVFSIQGAAPANDDIVWGTLGQDINLDIPGFQMINIDDIHWEKGKKKVVRFQISNKPKNPDEKYNVSVNGTLKIKHLMLEDSDTYKVVIYDKDGKNALEKTFQLKIQEKVSTPNIDWNCINKTLVCKISNGTDPELKLYVNGTSIKPVSSKFSTYRFINKRKILVNCTAENKVSKESDVKMITCSEKGLDLYFIIGVCGGSTLFVIFMVLLIFYINKRKKQNSRKNDEELEIRACRLTTKKRGPKPCQVPGSTPQSPAASRPPPPPSHRPQAPGHRPPPPGHRAQHNQQRKAPPPPATQVYQQKGPPLPRPRVQPKAPRGATGNS